MTKEEALLCIDAGFATMTLNTESRIASLMGQGFYTIGPAGEELLSAVGLVLRPTDALALHYRHLATQIARQFKSGRSVEDVMLDRARGHAVSVLDPITAGGHCCIGGGKYDFLVTSTLASQAPPAVGRALGNGLAHGLGVPSLFPKDFISYVSVGDGSVNHSHYLAAVNLAEYAQFRGFKCPTIFAISDNDISISLKGYGWLTSEWYKKLRMQVYFADGNNLLEIYSKISEAATYSRKNSKPSTIIFRNIPRRFGHAATDRQDAYLSKEEIQKVAGRNPLSYACAQLVHNGVITYPELVEKFNYFSKKAEEAFIKAVKEPKITTREEIMVRTSQPRVELPTNPEPKLKTVDKKDRHVMRKHMTAVFDELLTKNKNLVYIGEDVEHGGYYLVTDGLAKKFTGRVRDFFPEETSIIGAGMGFSQTGLIPIVEIPYAKYLDCGYDLFQESAITNWLSNGKQPNGMIYRIQGFDRGLFGGNFHTHNTISTPPGVDVVCYSNGPDYARGMRYALEQARKGRIVVSIDSTNLLNLKYISGNEGDWQFPYTDPDEMFGFDDIRMYGTSKSLAIIAYGNTIIAALQAQKELLKINISCTVIDSPLISDIPKSLKKVLPEFSAVVFADVCKAGQNPLSGFVGELQNERLLPKKWRIVAAQKTYNPLGCVLTFTSRDDILDAVLDIYNKK
uniref:3-methyl-2-oxobutanoate dehydrogenase (2-methylpropanoyl-transferring) n=1 Tax=Arcella intermedia TaxID=1963864 RepID=A0A6B2KYX5_9EUKA